MASKKNAAIGFIFVTLLLDVIGLGLIVPVIPSLLQGMLHSDISTAANYNGWMGFAYAGMQFLFAPLLGNLSDRYGRRPILLLSLFGLGIDYIFLAFAPTIIWLFVGRIVSGFAGASYTAATAYIADISTDENRAKNFGMIGAAFGLGFIIGPAIGGLLGNFGDRIPFMVAAGLSLLNCIYGYFVLPESLAPENRRSFDWKRASPIGTVKHLKKYPAITGLIIAFALMYLAGQSVQTTWSFFTIHKFHWTKLMVGISLAIVGALVVGVQGGLIRIINPKLGDKKTVYLGVMLYAIGLFLFSIASTTWMMFAILVIYCLGGLCGPALQSIISRQVPANEQGELQGGLTSAISFTSILGPLIMSNTFSYFTKQHGSVYFPGAAFFLGGIFMLMSLWLIYKALHTNQSIS